MPPPKGVPNLLEGPGDFDVTPTVHNHSYPAISSLNPTPTHTGKSVFIAGASRGIGTAIAISFAQAGASQIAIAARSDLSSVAHQVLDAASKAIRPTPKVISVKLDITSKTSTQEAADFVEKEFGKLDIVIINAGIFPKPSLIGDSDPDEWWEKWDVNVNGPYLVTRAFLPLLLEGGDKTIITTSSVGAHLVGPSISAYQTGKLAVLRFMEFVAAEYKDKGIVAFCIRPGNIPTTILGPDGPRKDIAFAFTETEDLPADTLVFLTREKRDWLSGRYVNVTWDMPELMAKEADIVKGNKLKVKLDF